MYLPDYFNWGSQTYVMGVLNVTPDSFSGDGLLPDNNLINRAIYMALDFVENGANLIDIGGESTRPGSNPVAIEEELQRVIPVVETLSSKITIPISVDTTKSEVANAALHAGASIINDVSGLHHDKKMAETVSQHNASLIIMHNTSKHHKIVTRPTLGSRYKASNYNNLIEQIIDSLNESLNIAVRNNVLKDNIIIDPGLGFGKSVEQDCQIINQLNKFKKLRCPILIGPSRKSFIGYTLDLTTKDRLEGTASAVSIGIANGADIIRVHDVKSMSRVAKMSDAIIRR